MALGGARAVWPAGTPGVASDDDRILGQGEGEGGLPSSLSMPSRRTSMAVWVGTLQGPAVFYQPSGLAGPIRLMPSKS